MKNDFLDIPSDELLVPFPNFGAVLMQHGRNLGGKTAMDLESGPISYAQLLLFCRTHTSQDLSPACGLTSYSQSILNFIACLYHGIAVHLEFKNTIPIKMVAPDMLSEDVPYVRLSTQALSLTEKGQKYSYTQYHLLCAAQAVGKAFHLFREGDALLFSQLSTLTDLTAGLLACLYYGKTTRFSDAPDLESFFQGKTQYVYTPVLDQFKKTADSRVLKNSAVLCCSNNSGTNAGFIYRLTPHPACSGLGNIMDSNGNYIQLLGLNNPQDSNSDDEPSGHICVDPHV